MIAGALASLLVACGSPAPSSDRGDSARADTLADTGSADGDDTADSLPEDTAPPRDTSCQDDADGEGTGPEPRPADAHIALPSPVTYARVMSAAEYAPGTVILGDPGYSFWVYSYSAGCDLGGVYVLSPGDGEEIDGSDAASHWFTEDGTCLGWSVASGFDLDGDGMPEIAAGAPYDTTNGGDPTFPDGSGKVLLFDGAGLTSELAPDATWLGENGRKLGWSVVGLPDLDGDGRDELLVGGGSDAWLLPGGALPADGTLPAGDARFDEAEGPIEVLGDLDGDGLPEFAGEAWCSTDRRDCMRIWRGADVAAGPVTGDDAAATMDVDDPASVASAGDGDADGYGDFFVDGALFRGPRVLAGGEDATPCDAVRFYTATGHAMMDGADAGDPDGDGRADLTLHFWGYGREEGGVYLFSAADLPWVGTVDEDAAWDALDLTGQFATRPPVPLDVDGDGADDLLGFDVLEGDDGAFSYAASVWWGAP